MALLETSVRRSFSPTVSLLFLLRTSRSMRLNLLIALDAKLATSLSLCVMN
eukprot:m.480022 g.480022  ORF g.480022 m.480022 type:complete len:51 (+) comp51480_c0_seq1:455-607(+)